jgi:hypothetical protein
MLSDSETASAPAGATGNVLAISGDVKQGDCQCGGLLAESPEADILARLGMLARIISMIPIQQNPVYCDRAAMCGLREWRVLRSSVSAAWPVAGLYVA